MSKESEGPFACLLLMLLWFAYGAEQSKIEISDRLICVYNKLDEIKKSTETKEEYEYRLWQKRCNAELIIKYGNELLEQLQSNDVSFGLISHLKSDIGSKIGLNLLDDPTESFCGDCTFFNLACFDFDFKQEPLSHESEAWLKTCPSLKDSKAGNMYAIRSKVKKALRYLINYEKKQTDSESLNKWRKELIKWERYKA